MKSSQSLPDIYQTYPKSGHTPLAGGGCLWNNSTPIRPLSNWK